MENAPTIILFWYFGIVICILAVALLMAAIILKKKGKNQGAKVCLIFSIICSLPIVLVVGYILYLLI